MKKLMSIVVLLAVSVALHAQKSVTEFLGIPVDGTKSEMIRKLKAKGFESNLYDKDLLEGEFNGQDVQVNVVTNNNKVYRIFILDANPTNEALIKIRFNNLCYQFNNNNGKYLTGRDQTIPEDEDISYEMSVNSKTYEAIFFQKLPADSIEAENKANAILSEKYTPEQLANPTEEIELDIFQTKVKTYSDTLSNCYNRIVWFRIIESYGKYYIAMYYDNDYNQADGSDL